MALLNRTNYPNIDPTDIGKQPNVGFGTVPDVLCHAIEAGTAHRLERDMTITDTSFQLDSVEGYPAPPFIVQISDERMTCQKIDVITKTMTVARGYDDTEPSPHNKNKVCFEVRSRYVYEVSDLAMVQILRVMVDATEQVSQFRAYSGRAGDEHPDYPGKGVLEFPAEKYIGRQRNLEFSGETKTGNDVAADVKISSRAELTDANATTFLQMSAIGAQSAFVAFKGYGGVMRSVYTADVDESSGGSPAKITLTITDINNKIKKKKTFALDAAESAVLDLSVAGGAWTDVFKISVDYGDVEVYDMSATMTVPAERYGRDEINAATATATKGLEHIDGTGGLATYVDEGLGTPTEQTHSAIVTVDAGGADVLLAAVEPEGNKALGIKEIALPEGIHTLSVTHVGGSWTATTRVAVIRGLAQVSDFEKTIAYQTEETKNAKDFAATTSARIVIGNEITVDAIWTADEAGDYVAPGAAITRPDHVIQKFLISQKGFTSSDFDAPSFAAAGALYASAISGGYTFDFVYDGQTSARDLAGEARSVLSNIGGVWHLTYIPDVAPAATATVDQTELYGKQATFEFRETPVYEIANSLTGKYRLLRGGSPEGVVTAEDAASIAKYGRGSPPQPYRREFIFKTIRSDAMAQSVLGHRLVELKEPRLIIDFLTFWSRFGINITDTVAISGGLFSSKKFFVERKERDAKTAKFTCREWF